MPWRSRERSVGTTINLGKYSQQSLKTPGPSQLRSSAFKSISMSQTNQRPVSRSRDHSGSISMSSLTHQSPQTQTATTIDKWDKTSKS